MGLFEKRTPFIVVRHFPEAKKPFQKPLVHVTFNWTIWPILFYILYKNTDKMQKIIYEYIWRNLATTKFNLLSWNNKTEDWIRSDFQTACWNYNSKDIEIGKWFPKLLVSDHYNPKKKYTDSWHVNMFDKFKAEGCLSMPTFNVALWSICCLNDFNHTSISFSISYCALHREEMV